MVARVVSVPWFLVVAVASKTTLAMQKTPTTAIAVANIVSSSVTPWSFGPTPPVPHLTLPPGKRAGRQRLGFIISSSSRRPLGCAGTPGPRLHRSASGNGHGIDQAVRSAQIDCQASVRERPAGVVNRKPSGAEVNLKGSAARGRIGRDWARIDGDAGRKTIGQSLSGCKILRSILVNCRALRGVVERGRR